MDIEFYEPRIKPQGLKKIIKKNTSLIYFESPGSHTFELQDLPSLTKVAKAYNLQQ